MRETLTGQTLAPLHVVGEQSNQDHKNGRVSRFPLIPFDKIALNTERRYLVDGLLPLTGVGSLWGAHSVGKTFYVFDLSMHCALGRDYRGRQTCQCPVVHCAFEGQFGFDARKEAFAQYKMNEMDGQKDVPFFLMPHSLNLIKEHEGLIESIRMQTGEVPPGLVNLDTLARSIEGSESSDEAMGAYFRAADAIRQAFDCCVLIIHHCGYDKTHSRGHTSLPSNSEFELKMEISAQGLIVTEVLKMKEGPVGEKVFSKLETVEVGSDNEDKPITSCIVVEAAASEPARDTAPSLTKNQTTFLTILEQVGQGGLTVEEWNAQAREIGLGAKRKQDLYDLRVALENKKLVYEFNGRWMLTFKG